MGVKPILLTAAGLLIGVLITDELLDRGVRNPEFGLALPMLIVPLGTLVGLAVGAFVREGPPAGPIAPGIVAMCWAMVFLAPILIGAAYALMRGKRLRWLLFIPLVLILYLALPISLAPAHPFLFPAMVGVVLTFIIPPVVYMAG